jgi:hypothetical protein
MPCLVTALADDPKEKHTRRRGLHFAVQGWPRPSAAGGYPPTYRRITLSDRKRLENARSTTVLRGLGHHRRSPLRRADQVGLARHGDSPPVRVRGSDVVVLVPQLVSQAARRSDRLDGEAVFEAA